MTDEEIKTMQTENAKLKADLATSTTEVTTLKESNTKLGEDIKERDTKIGELRTQAGERAQQFKLLKDMTAAEKELLSEKELEIMQRTEKLETDRQEANKIQAERDQKQRDFTIDSLATKYAKGNKDLVAQIKINLGKLDPKLLEGALTEQDLTPHVESAFKMTGAGTGADPLRTAHNAGGETAPIDNPNNFATSEDGKKLAGALGLSQATPEGAKAADGGAAA